MIKTENIVAVIKILNMPGTENKSLVIEGSIIPFPGFIKIQSYNRLLLALLTSITVKFLPLLGLKNRFHSGFYLCVVEVSALLECYTVQVGNF